MSWDVSMNTALEGGVPCITIVFDAKIRPVIDLIDKLRHLGLENDVSLPTIVVVGDQSSGKSSVLEALSGVQLPRGSGDTILNTYFSTSKFHFHGIGNVH